MVSKAFAHFQVTQPAIWIGAAVLTCVITCTLLCCQKTARSVPTNYILLFVFTVCEAYLVGMICSSIQDQEIVLMAAAMTLAVTLALTIYALTTKTDFTMCGGFFFVGTMLLLMFGLFYFIYPSKVMYNMYCIGGVLLYGFYLIYDTQLIAGGKRYELSMDDYVIGALMLYIDIIHMFIRILALFSKK